jgi:hypothetical protein
MHGKGMNWDRVQKRDDVLEKMSHQRDRLKRQKAFRARVAHKRRITERVLSERASAKAAFNEAIEQYKCRKSVLIKRGE